MIVKCLDTRCCEPFITNWMTIFPKRFLPLPAVYKFGSNGLLPVEPSEYAKKPNDYKFATLKERLVAGLIPSEANNFNRTPFDLYCPSMMEKLSKCICDTCGLYWPSEAAKKRHATCHRNGLKENQLVYSMEEVSDEFCQIQNENENINGPNGIPVIENLEEFLKCPFSWPDRASDVQFDEILL